MFAGFVDNGPNRWVDGRLVRGTNGWVYGREIKCSVRQSVDRSDDWLGWWEVDEGLYGGVGGFVLLVGGR